MDPSNIPVPETPGKDDSGLELIGQEMVIRTVHQTSQHPSALPTNAALATPTRRTSGATRALTDGAMEGSVEEKGEGFAIQPLVYPKGSPEVFGPEGRTPGTGGSLPLFTQDQLGRLHDLQRQAPFLYGSSFGGPPVQGGPPFQSAQLVSGPSSMMPPMIQMTPGPVSEGQGDVRFHLEDLKQLAQQLAHRNQLLTQETQQLAQANVPLRARNFSLKEELPALKHENDLLKMRLSLFDVQAGTPVFATPDQEADQADHFPVGYEIPENVQAFSNVQVTQNVPVISNAQVLTNDVVTQNVQVPVNAQVLTNDVVTQNAQVLENDEVPDENLFDLFSGVQIPEDDNHPKQGGGGGSNYIPEELFGKNYGRMTGQGPREKTGAPQPATSSSNAGGSQQQGDMIQLMAKMMEGMTNLQKQIMDGKENESENVRSNLELPQLTEWSASSGPVDLSDWLCVVEPLMADLSNSSAEWWTVLTKEAQAWYEAHLRLQPLDRVSHEPNASSTLAQRKWVRLERRASSMLLLSVPKTLREELISTKRVSALAIICHLMMLYQPGGLAEKELILRQLESPPESESTVE